MRHEAKKAAQSTVVPAKAGTHADVPKSVRLIDDSIFGVQNTVVQYGFPLARE
jgi:hypothetical protein